MPAKKITAAEKQILIEKMAEAVGQEERIQQALKEVENRKAQLSDILETIGKIAGVPRDVLDEDGTKLGTAYSAKFRVAGDLKQLKARWNREQGRMNYYFVTQLAEDTIEVA